MTSNDQSHGPIRDLMAPVALGTASDVERRAVEAHVAGCDPCRAEMAQVRRTVGLIGLGAPATAVPDLGRVRARLLERIAESGAAHEAAPERVPYMKSMRRPSRMPYLLAAAAVILLVLSAGWLWTALGQRRALEATVAADRAAAAAQIAALRDSLADKAAMIAALTGPDVRVVTLASSGARRPSGRMFWDPRAGRWTLVEHDLPAVGAGRTYQLWIITSAGRKISAGTFQPVAGNAMMQMMYPLPENALGAIAVTEEPAGGMPQPTGEIVISGATG